MLKMQTTIKLFKSKRIVINYKNNIRIGKTTIDLET